MMTEDIEKKCPKCGYIAIHRDECPKCGLLFSKYKALNKGKYEPGNQGKKAITDPTGPELLKKADDMAFYQILTGVLIVLICILFISNQLYKAHGTSPIDNELESIIRFYNKPKINSDERVKSQKRLTN